MALSLGELKEWAPEIADLAKSARDVAASHTDSAEFYRSLVTVSTWEGQGAEAAAAAMQASARDHVAEDLGNAATRMEHVGQDAEDVAETIKGILDDAATAPAVGINESTNQVIPPDTGYMTDEYAAQVAAKVTDLQQRIATVLGEGERLDADLAGAIAAAAGDGEPATKTAASLEDLLLPGTGDREAPERGESPPAPHSLDSALDQLTGKPGHQPPGPGDQASGPARPLPLDPKVVEDFKNTARQVLQRDGVPADQIEARLDAMVAAAQKPLAPSKPPKPESMPEPGFADGFADGWFNTEEGIKDLVGANGWEDFKDSWTDMGKGTWERITNPTDYWTEEVKHATKYPGHYLGEKTGETALTAPGAVFGAEGALAARAAAGSGIPDDLIDGSSAPTSGVDHPTPLGDTDYPAPVVPDHHLAPVEGPPILSDTGRPEFTLSNPVDHMSPELRGLAEQHLTGSGETVLGPYNPVGGGQSYIDVAQDNGASYFDIGDAWNAATPTERLAANQHVLDMAITNGDTITLSVPARMVPEDSFTAAEIRYLEAHGYQRSDANTLIPPVQGAG